MKQCPCGKYYLGWGTVCPFCGYKLSRQEWKDHVAQLKAEKARPKTQDELERTREVGRRQQEVANEYYRKRKIAERAELISVEYEQSVMEAIGRASVGDWLFGDIGAYAGAATTPTRAKSATFLVTYADGRTGKETVKVGSKRYNELYMVIYRELMELI